MHVHMHVHMHIHLNCLVQDVFSRHHSILTPKYHTTKHNTTLNVLNHPHYTTFLPAGDRERELSLPITFAFDRNNPVPQSKFQLVSFL